MTNLPVCVNSLFFLLLARITTLLTLLLINQYKYTMECTHSIVLQPLELSTSQCRQIIQKKINSNNFEIVNFELVPLDTRNGFLGEHRRLIIKIKRNNENAEKIEIVNCFAKFFPENQVQIEFVIICGVFKKEVFFYEKLLPKIENMGISYLKNVIPECYYVKEDQILVFEDVTSKGFKPLSKYGYLNYEHVLVTIKTMAKLHAASFIFEEKMSLCNNKTYRLSDDYEDYFYESFYVDDPKHKGGQGVYASLKGLLTGFEMYPDENFDLNNNKFRLNVEKICLDIFKLVKPSKKFRNCICHGDLWSTNIMIKYDNNNKPINCLMLDFQTIRYCPPGHDFMSFIFLTTTREFRSKHMKYLQQIYYDELKMLLANYGFNIEILLPFKEFLESCDEQKRFAILQTATYVQLTQADEKYIAEFIKNEDDWNTALYVDRSVLVRENCKINSNYRAVILETLKDLKDICDINS